MSEPILIGTRGWDRPNDSRDGGGRAASGTAADWTGGFYPEALPDDWRLGYYVNHLRAVLVPAETMARADAATVRAWTEDAYEEFRFVVEVPATLADISRLIAPIRSQVAGLLLCVPPVLDLSWLTARLSMLAATFPVCVDLPADWRAPDTLGVLAAHGAGLCWHTEVESLPSPGGRLMVALTSVHAPKELRRVLEALHAWQGEEGVAGLFFDNPEAARQARLLAELMVV